jgi:dihydrofolate reductase
MRTLNVFNSVTLDGYFVDGAGDMSWAHSATPDPEWDTFVDGNASGGGELLFGRVTYQLMASYWPTEAALKANPTVAKGMNALRKVVFSRTLPSADWSNTTLIKDDLVGAVRRMKAGDGPGMTILGSGEIVSQLTQAGLIDTYQVVVVPVVIGAGRTMFDGVEGRIALKRTSCRAFANGRVVLGYERA